jgi:ATP-dependent protease ClpP protease subunit
VSDQRFHIADITAGLPSQVLTWLTSCSATKEGGQVPCITIDSEGGNVRDALAVVDLLRLVSFPINVFVIGSCWSASLAIFLAVPQANRYALHSASFMIHFGKTSVQFSSTKERNAELSFHSEFDRLYDDIVLAACLDKASKGSLRKSLKNHESVYKTRRQAQKMGWLLPDSSSNLRCADVLSQLMVQEECDVEEEEGASVVAERGVATME